MHIEQLLMTPDEKWRRYLMARREAGSELMNFIHAISTDDDAYDAIEMSFMWRQICEGGSVTDMTWELMLEATNQ